MKCYIGHYTPTRTEMDFFFKKKKKKMHNEIMSHFSKIFFDEGYSAQILEARIGPGVTIVDGAEIRLCK